MSSGVSLDLMSMRFYIVRTGVLGEVDVSLRGCTY